MNHSGRILIVDDDLDCISLMRTFLKGYEVETATNAADAITLITNKKYSCIISDISMPYQNGIDLLTKIRKAGVSTPFLLTSTRRNKEKIKELYNYSLHGFLEKPISKPQLLTLVEQCLSIAKDINVIENSWENKIDYDDYSLIEVASNLPNIALIVAPNGEIVFFNKYAHQKLRIETPINFEDIFVGTNLYDFIEKSKADSVLGVIKYNKTEMKVISTCSILRNKSGAHVGTFIVSKDITETEMHRKSLLLFEKALKATHHGIVITDKRGDIIWVNPRVEELTGYTSNELVGQNPRILKSGKMPTEFYKEFWGAISSGETWSGVFINKKKNQDIYYERQSITPVINDKHRIEYYIAVKEDITNERKNAKELDELRAVNVTTSKLAALGEMAGNIAHQVNTPLGTILLKLDNLVHKIENQNLDKTSCINDVKSIKDVTKDVSKIITSIQNLYRRGNDNKSSIDVNDVFRELHTLCDERFSAKGVILVSKNDITDDTFFSFNRIELQQILLNLLNNSFDALNELPQSVGKKVTLHCYNSSQTTIISVSDSGHGVPRELANKVFKPFFTTKSTTNGTGVGLNLCQKLAHKNDSQLKLYFDENGSRFNLAINSNKKETPSIDDWEGFNDD